MRVSSETLESPSRGTFKSTLIRTRLSASSSRDKSLRPRFVTALPAILSAFVGVLLQTLCNSGTGARVAIRERPTDTVATDTVASDCSALRIRCFRSQVLKQFAGALFQVPGQLSESIRVVYSGARA